MRLSVCSVAHRARILLALLVAPHALAGCAAQQTPAEGAPTSRPAREVQSGDGLRTSEEVQKALEKAQAAYMDGRWDEAVVEATKVIEGAADTDEYYQAVKVLGLAACNRKDPRPAAFAFERLNPDDKATLKYQCQQNGLTVSDDGTIR